MKLYLTVSIQDENGRPLLSKGVELDLERDDATDGETWIANALSMAGFGPTPVRAAVDWLDNAVYAGVLA